MPKEIDKASAWKYKDGSIDELVYLVINSTDLNVTVMTYNEKGQAMKSWSGSPHMFLQKFERHK